jgi:hypothetical protein
MNRRGFFRRTVGALIATVVGPRVLDWKTIPSTVTIGAINRATFKFWRNQGNVTSFAEPSDRVYFLSKDGPYVLNNDLALRKIFEDCAK